MVISSQQVLLALSCMKVTWIYAVMSAVNVMVLIDISNYWGLRGPSSRLSQTA